MDVTSGAVHRIRNRLVAEEQLGGKGLCVDAFDSGSACGASRH
jgi:hypothetical protein